jgi:hypothetical protein
MQDDDLFTPGEGGRRQLASVAINTELMRLPVERATLPATCVKAKEALARCSQIDECKDWADKAAALASYAKQAGDKTLWRMAVRIQGRAIRRCGELLKQTEAKHTGRPSKNGAGAGPNSRKACAQRAGLSTRQMKTAVRVASVPVEDFETQIESADPPSVTALAEQGTKKQTRSEVPAWMTAPKPPEFAEATMLIGDVERLAEFCATHEAKAMARGVLSHEIATVCEHITITQAWPTSFLRCLEGAAR